MSAQVGQPAPMTAVQKLAAVNEQTWLSMGGLAELMTDYDRAASCYEQALRHNPYSVQALSQIASLCRGREQFSKAVDYFKRILTIQENNGEIWGALGHCYLMMDNLQDAYHAYQQALYHLPNPRDPKLWYGIGILYDRYGSLEHAEEAFSAVMKMEPKFEKANEIYFRLGIIYKQQQKYDLSLQCFRYILHSPPRPLTEIDIWFQTGHVYEQQKEYQSAKDAYERVLAENPDHAKVLQQLGWLYHQQNASFANQAMAIQYLTRSLKSDGNDAQSWYLLGRCYMAEQNYNKAYEAYQQAVYRDARNPTFWCSIGVLYYQINQYRDALDAYSRAIRLNPYISEVWYDLGTLYESCNNQVQDALDAYQRAADLDPTNPHIKQRLELLRKSQGSSAGAPAAPVPQDVNNPNQYQNGQPLNGSAFSQSGGPQGPPAGMAQYPSIANSQRGSESRAGMHEYSSHESAGGPPRDLPMPGGNSGMNRRSSPGPYSQHPASSPRDDVRIADIGGGRAPTPSERTQMNPIHDGRPMAHPPSQPSPLPKRQQHPGRRDDMRSIPPVAEPSRVTPPMGRPPSTGHSPQQHYSSPRQHHAAPTEPHYMHHDQPPTTTNRRSSDPYEHEGIFHRVQPKSSPQENNGFHPVHSSPAVKQEESAKADEQRAAAAAAAAATASSRQVDEDYDETAADTLMSIAGGRKRSLDRNDDAANVDSDSKRPKAEDTTSMEVEQPETSVTVPEESQAQTETESDKAEERASIATAAAPATASEREEAREKQKSPSPAEQPAADTEQPHAEPEEPESTQPVEEEPKAEPEPADEPMAEAEAPEQDQPAVEEPAKDEDDEEQEHEEQASAVAEETEEDKAEEGEAEPEPEPEKEEGETDGAEPAKDDAEPENDDVVSEPEAGEVTPSPEATTA
ncbi:glucose repression mediator protein [Umbelopsis sp. WA50703]